MLCSSCGAENADGARFCVKCGAAQSAAPAPGSWQTPSGNLFETIPSGGLNNPQAGAGSQPAGGGQSQPGGGGSYSQPAGGGYSQPGGGGQAQPGGGGYAQPGAGGYGSTSYGAGSAPGPASSPNDYYQSAPAQPAAYQPSGGALYAPGYGPAPWAAQGGTKADPGLRVASYLIDVLGWAVVTFVLSLIPFFGWLFALFLAPILTTLYMLLRDTQGVGSPGKHLLGMKVMSKDGGEAPTGARVLRNLPLAIPAAFTIIPILGHAVGIFFGVIIVITEVVTMLSTGERVGDKIANTTVIKTART